MRPSFPPPAKRTLLSTIGGLATLLAGTTANASEPLSFEHHVRPILKAYCFHCHGEESNPKGKLDLRLARFVKRGGESGEAVIPGDHSQSLLWERIDLDEMPPGEKKLSAADKRVIADWIDQGARAAKPEPETLAPGPVFSEEERTFWSFRPVVRPEIPVVKDPGRITNPIDAFVLHRLETAGLGFSPEANRRTLIRRLTYDLHGLPPTPDEIDAFLEDERIDAYERLVERLLASPRYGERWARHWMDVAGYADSDGYSARDDVRKYVYKYRDYLIRSLNADRPWSELIREQLAGDEMLRPPYSDLSPEDQDRLIATGFLRLAPDGTADPEVDAAVARNDVVAETIKIVSTSLLGLTVGCAQCHAHRYDPIAQEDYYRFRAIFEPALDPANWRVPSGRLISLWREGQRAKAAVVDAEVKSIEAERAEAVEQLVAEVLAKELAQAPESLRPKLSEAREARRSEQTAEQKQLLHDYPRIIVSPGNVSLYDARAHREIMKKFAAKIDVAKARRPAEDFVHALTETPGRVPVTKLFARGDHQQPRQAIAPGELAILTDAGGTPEIPSDDPEVPTTGRRLSYARHLTSGRHPLVSRVLVNRVWMQHFGRGIVPTPGDYGSLGERPSHPELLDWLADGFVKSGWSLKNLHRLIVTSTVYRQSSRRDPKSEVADPDNRLLARMSVRRLEAEAVRDAVLSVSGRLNGAMYGPPVPVAPDEAGQVVIGKDNRDSAGRPIGKMGSLGGEEARRSIYIQVRRSLPLGLMENFDAPSMTPNCERRANSTVATQSLLMMNSEFIVNEAEAFARRVEGEAGEDRGARIERAWRLALGVEPSKDHVEVAKSFLDAQRRELGGDRGEHNALSSLCQALLASNAFLYVD